MLLPLQSVFNWYSPLSLRLCLTHTRTHRYRRTHSHTHAHTQTHTHFFFSSSLFDSFSLSHSLSFAEDFFFLFSPFFASGWELKKGGKLISLFAWRVSLYLSLAFSSSLLLSLSLFHTQTHIYLECWDRESRMSKKRRWNIEKNLDLDLFG